MEPTEFPTIPLTLTFKSIGGEAREYYDSPVQVTLRYTDESETSGVQIEVTGPAAFYERYAIGDVLYFDPTPSALMAEREAAEAQELAELAEELASEAFEAAVAGSQPASVGCGCTNCAC